MSTCDPFATDWPSLGTERITVPTSAAENAELTAPSVRLAWVKVLDASSLVWPTSLGTATLAVPLLMTTLTVSPRETGVPAVGAVLITRSTGTVSEFAESSFKRSPRWLASFRTCAMGCPTQFGNAKACADGEGE